MCRASLLAVALLAGLGFVISTNDIRAGGADKGKIAGILIDRKDRTLTIRADGDDDPAKYVLPAKPDAKLAAALKGLFNVQRVQITYKTDGNEREITSLVRQPGKANGTLTGIVIAVHDNFWVEVKPANGPPEGFASGAPDKSKDIVAVLKTLEKGDTVTLRWYSDFERHRIVAIQKVMKK